MKTAVAEWPELVAEEPFAAATKAVIATSNFDRPFD
jgi:hypothetical protein